MKKTILAIFMCGLILINLTGCGKASSKDGKNYSDDAIRALTEFQEKYFESVIIR